MSKLEITPDRQWIHLPEYLKDFHTPLEDIEDITFEWNNLSWLKQDNIKTISLKCEDVVVSLLYIIICVMKLDLDIHIQDGLKNEYNKLRKLDYKYGDLYYIPRLHHDILKEKTEICICKTISGIAQHIYIMHDIRMNSIPVRKQPVSFSRFSASLKKLESSVIGLVYILKLNNVLENEINKLESMILSLH